MVVGVAIRGSAVDAVIVLLTDVKLTANDWLHTYLIRSIYKMDSTEDVAVVGHGDSRHSQLFRPVGKLFHITCSVEHGVVRMQVQVHELRHVALF